MRILLKGLVAGGILIIVGALVFGLTAKTFFVSKCEQPLRYALGNIDTRFGLSESEVRQVLEDAEAVWEHSTGINLFESDPQATMKVHFVFDERQKRTLETKNLESQLEKVETAQKGISDKYDALTESYQKKLKQYKAEVADYEERLEEYEQKVVKWNAQGGAPSDEYKKLEKERKLLQEEAVDLEKQQRAINVLAQEINSLIRQERRLVENYNTQVSTYESRYGGSREFDQGVYTGDAITIYQFNEMADLRLVLAHELGHALGLGHTEDPASIMHYLMSEQDMDNLDPTAEDKAALEMVCRTSWQEAIPFSLEHVWSFLHQGV
jgi:hypothetical protein